MAFRLSLFGVIAAVLGVFLFGLMMADPDAAISKVDFTIEPSDWQFADFLPLQDVPEPSGIVYYPGRDTFFVVDDGDKDRPSALYEVELVKVTHPEYGEVVDAKVVAKLELGKDLEGVCLNWTNGFLYVCDEAGEKVYEVAPDGPRHLRTFKVSPEFGGKLAFEQGGDGFEGIAFRAVPGLPLGGEFYLANQNDPTCVLKVVLTEKGGEIGREPVTVKIQKIIDTEQINLGDLMFDEKSEKLWLSHAWQNLLQVVDPDTGESIRWELLPGCAQEGITIDADGRLWIAQDVGGIAVYEKR
jgi:uncharacterized protein YjiK